MKSTERFYCTINQHDQWEFIIIVNITCNILHSLVLVTLKIKSKIILRTVLREIEYILNYIKLFGKYTFPIDVTTWYIMRNEIYSWAPYNILISLKQQRQKTT